MPSPTPTPDSQLPFTLQGVVDSIIAAFIVITVTWILSQPTLRRVLRYNSMFVRISTSILALIVFAAVALIRSQTATILTGLAVIAVLSYYHLKPLHRLNSVGVVDADLTVGSGVDYRQSLTLCQNRFDFLGVGASKLTSLPEFSQLVRRCNRTFRPIRLLLCDPDDLIIQIGASRENVNVEAKRQAIQHSLKLIAELKRTGNHNIEVRFYSGTDELAHPKFRLVFIDNSICLVSYRVWGFGDGSGLPQLRLMVHSNHREESSFYYPFREYFEALWKASESSVWDFQKYI